MQTDAVRKSVPSRSQTSSLPIRCLAGLLLLAVTPALRGQSASADFQRILSGKDPSGSPAAPNTPKDRIESEFFYANKGPWGKLHCLHIFIEAPTEIMEGVPMPNTIPRWSFPASDAARLPALFKKAGLPETLSAALLDPARQVAEEGKLHLFPPLEALEAMTPAMRNVIYPELARLQDNEFHANPVLITTDTVEEWYRTSKLRPEIVSKIQQMSYKRGDCIAFSDVPAILNHAQSNSEARLIFKTFTRTRALMVRLELDKDTNVGELLNYWTTGLGLRRKDIEPIMQSIIETNGVNRLDIVHILPALTRKLLYTFPSPEMNRQGILPDCHWTSLNFFNYTPHDYLLDGRLATSSVMENFQQVDPPYLYGDILFFVDAAEGNAFHSCVYLADEIVYHKNGRNTLAPWLLSKLSDVKRIYLYNGNGRIQGYRNKNAIGALRKS